MVTTGLTLDELQQAIAGNRRFVADASCSSAAEIARVVIDSREIRGGDVFWALKGNHHDGSDFVADAFRRGAAGVVCRRQSFTPPPGRWALLVENSLAALWSVAAFRRQRFRGTLVAVTGSVGKTTSRNMIHTVLGSALRGVASPRNYNNHIGLPLGMLGLEGDLDYGVFELGASAEGEVAQLAELCRPRIGVITRIADAHLGGFGGYQKVAKAKFELLASLPDDGLAVLNGDDPRLRRRAAGLRVRCVWVGRGLDNDLVATHVRSRNGMLSFRADGQSFRVAVWGRHYLVSALSAVAVAREMGLSSATIAEALSAYEHPSMRCQVVRIGGITVVNDTYNASPVSMRAALELLRDFETSGRRVVVCGDMLELGDMATALHQKLGQEIVSTCGADAMAVCGENAGEVVEAAVAAGMPAGQAASFRWPEECLPWLLDSLQPGDVVLVKGSRALEMERIVQRLTENRQALPQRKTKRRHTAEPMTQTN